MRPLSLLSSIERITRENILIARIQKLRKEFTKVMETVLQTCAASQFTYKTITYTMY